MAEAIFSYDGKVRGQDGELYSVQACGQRAKNTVWEGWLEFVPDDGSTPLRTARETTQPNRDDLTYWASGLEMVYLEGALTRALAPAQKVSTPSASQHSVPDVPAPHEPHVHEGPLAALDPFHIHASQGNDVLRRQLAALEPWQLRNVAIAHSDVTESEAEEMDRAALTTAIMEAVQG